MYYVYIDTDLGQLVNSPVSTDQANSLIVYENDDMELAVQLLQRNSVPSPTRPYQVMPTASNDMAMLVSFGIPHQTSPIIIDSQYFGYDPAINRWTGSLCVSGSNLVSLMLSGSNPSLEVTVTGSYYRQTYVQQSVAVLADVNKD